MPCGPPGKAERRPRRKGGAYEMRSFIHHQQYGRTASSSMPEESEA